MPVSPTPALDAAVEEFVTAALIGEGWDAALHQFAAAVHVTGAVLMSYDDYRLKGALPSAGLSEFYQRFFAGDAPPCSRLKRVKLSAGEGFRLDHDDYTDAELACDPFYQEFSRPHHAFWNAVVKLAAGPGNWGVELSIKRGLEAGPFTSAEKATLNRELPRLRTAVQIVNRIQDGKTEGVLQALAARGDFAFEINPWGQVKREYGPSEPKTKWPVSVIRGRLVAADPISQSGIDRAVHAATSEPGRATTALLQGRDGIRHFLQVIPVNGRAHDVFIGTAAVALVSARHAAHGRRYVDMTPLRDLFVFTEREAQVASLISDGLTPAEVARQLGVGIGTVRTHLKSVFQKSGTARQAELAALVARAGLR